MKQTICISPEPLKAKITMMYKALLKKNNTQYKALMADFSVSI